jgi:hypothetical protein
MCLCKQIQDICTPSKRHKHYTKTRVTLFMKKEKRQLLATAFVTYNMLSILPSRFEVLNRLKVYNTAMLYHMQDEV